MVPPVSIMSSIATQVPGHADDAVGHHWLGTHGSRVLWMKARGTPAHLSAMRTGRSQETTTMLPSGQLSRRNRSVESIAYDRPARREGSDLVGVQVDRHDPVGASRLEQVGASSRGDRFAATVRVLPGIRIERRRR